MLCSERFIQFQPLHHRSWLGQGRTAAQPAPIQLIRPVVWIQILPELGQDPLAEIWKQRGKQEPNDAGGFQHSEQILGHACLLAGFLHTTPGSRVIEMTVRRNGQLKNRFGRGLERELRHRLHHRADSFSSLEGQRMVSP